MADAVSKPENGGSRPVPDPTSLTTDQLRREIGALRELVEAWIQAAHEARTAIEKNVDTRLNGMDQAIELVRVSSEKIPLMITDQIDQLQALHAEKFESIEKQFIERDKRTEQLSSSDKTAIAAALQAQKEAAGATNEANGVALTKLETNFTKLIDQLQTLLSAVSRNTDEKINDIKGRLDRGEGKTSISDPAMADAVRVLNDTVKGLTVSRDTSAGSSAGSSAQWGWIVAGLTVVGMFATIVLDVLSKR